MKKSMENILVGGMKMGRRPEKRGTWGSYQEEGVRRGNPGSAETHKKTAKEFE